MAILLTGSYGLLTRMFPARAELAESNYQANLIRLQAFLFDNCPRTVIAGSSISGRLLPSYFRGTGLAPVANLGLDGSSPLFALELVLEAKPPPIVIIEENLLLKPEDANDASLRAATESFGFKLAKEIGIWRADIRPSSLLYSWLKSHQKKAPHSTDSAEQKAPTPRSPASPGLASLRCRNKLGEQIRALRARGSRVVLMRVPTGPQFVPKDNPSLPLGAALAREYDLCEVDLEAECAKRGQALSFSDGVHLTPASARQVSALLGELVSEETSTAKK